MPIGTPLQLVTRLDTKFGEIDLELAKKANVPTDGGAFIPNQIDLSAGAIEHDVYQQTGNLAFALNPIKTPVIGGSVSVNIRGNNAAVTFPSNFVGVDGLTSGTILTSGQSYPFYFRYAPDWEGVGQHRILVGALGTSSGQLIATPIKAFPGPHSSAVGEAVRTNTAGGSFDLAMPVGAAEGAIVGFEDNSPTSWSATNYVRLHTTDGAGFIIEATGAIQPGAIPDGVRLDGGNSALWRRTGGHWKFIGQTGLLSSGVSGGTWGSITGTLSAQTDLQGALNLKAPLANAALASPTLTNATFVAPVTVPDGALAIADVAGLQTALNSAAAAAPFRSTQTAAAVTLEAVMAAGLAANRHNTIVELAGIVDQEIDLAGLTTDTLVLIEDNYQQRGRTTVPADPDNLLPLLSRVLKGGSALRVVGPQDTAWNWKHDRVYLSPFGLAQVEHKQSIPLTRVSGPLSQLPSGPGIDPVSLSASTVDFDTNAPGKLTLTGGTPNKVTTWADTLGLLGASGPTQANDTNRPPILGTTGTKDYRVNFNNPTLPANVTLATNATLPGLPIGGFTMYFVGGHGKRTTTSGTNAFHFFGGGTGGNVSMALSIGTSAFSRYTPTAAVGGSPFNTCFLGDFVWTDQNKFIYVISYTQISATVGATAAAGFHELGGAARHDGPNYTPEALSPVSIAFGTTVSTQPFGFLQQFGVVPVPLTEEQRWQVVLYLKRKWMA